MKRTFLFAAASTLLLAACDKPAEAPPGDPPAAPAEQAARSAEPDTAPYVLSAANWEGPIGEEGYVIVSIEAVDGYKINEKYPQKLSLDAPPDGLELPLPEMKLADAQLESDKRLVFSVPAVAKRAGEYEVSGTVKIGVCNEETCIFRKETLTARVVAQ